MITLITPDTRYEEQYREMIATWEAAFEEPEPWVLREDYEDFEALVDLLRGFSHGERLRPGFYASHTFWALDEVSGRIVGAANLRPDLNAFQSIYGGHIGYGVRPDMRGKGFATEILARTLDKARALGLAEVLLCCYRENRASETVILRNGGIFLEDVESKETGRVIRRFRISL